VVGPNELDALASAKGKSIALFALPGAFTPGCSNTHLPSFLAAAAELRAAGVDEIWCVSVNDAYVMGAWGRQQGCHGIIRMIADGGAALTEALGLSQDLTAKGFGARSKRYSMWLVDGVVKALNLEEAGKMEVSLAPHLLAQIRAAKE
jgi:glutaredoxin/glutathione-dependent peroxiredoxin